MKMILLGLVLIGTALTACAEGGFVRSLPKDDFTAAGLQKLTPEELAHLEAAVQRYKSGEVASVEKQAEAKVRAVEQTAQVKIAAAEAKVAEVQVKEPPAAGRKQPGWFSALLTLRKAASAEPGKVEPMLSRLVGDFEGWNGRTIFTLENGTRWLQQNKSERYSYSPALHSPEVKITPAAMTGFWLQIKGVNLAVRVVPHDLGDKN